MERDGNKLKFTALESAEYVVPDELPVSDALDLADDLIYRATSLQERSAIYINDPGHGRAFQGAQMQQQAIDQMKFSRQILRLCETEVIDRMLSNIPGIDTKQ